jgi:glycosyltransferase involved in cell wall biosynthesis
MESAEITSKLKSYRCCVVLPTYNNPKTLGRVIDGVLTYTSDIIVVNDGSTDSTKEILSNYPQIIQLHQPKNVGKGNALKIGFKHAVSIGFDYAITLDTDGQHFPDDIPNFIEALDASENKNILIIGDRNMNEADVLARSAKGNRVSTFWMKAATGLKLQDSQSGFRLYPIKYMKDIRFMKSTKKFEFEIEAIVKSFWSGTEIVHVPIHVLYDMKERVSHFRPFVDIARMVVLYTWFLLVRLFYITPRDFFRKLKKKGLKRFLVEDFLRHQDSPKKKALSIALGVLIGLSPLWGFHTIIVIFLAIFLNLNKVISFAFSNISLPPFIPLVLLLSLQTGNWVLGINTHYELSSIVDNFDMVQNLKSYIIGSITLSISSAIIFGVLGYILFSVFDKKTVLAHD